MIEEIKNEKLLVKNKRLSLFYNLKQAKKNILFRYNALHYYSQANTENNTEKSDEVAINIENNDQFVINIENNDEVAVENNIETNDQFAINNKNNKNNPCLNVIIDHKNAVLPSKDKNNAGYDLSSIDNEIINPGQRKLISTGIKIELPQGCYGRIAPRSGLSLKHSLDIGAGVIDKSYQGVVKVLLINNGKNDYHVKIGDRIAELVVEYAVNCDVIEIEEFNEQSNRGQNGFGSSGY